MLSKSVKALSLLCCDLGVIHCEQTGGERKTRGVKSGRDWELLAGRSLLLTVYKRLWKPQTGPEGYTSARDCS